MRTLSKSSPALNVGLAIIARVADADTQNAQQLQLMQLFNAGELDELDKAIEQLIDEKNNEAPYIKYARPTFMYVFYIVIALSFSAAISGFVNPAGIAAAGAAVTTMLNAVPGELWALFGTCFIGYTGARSFDKREKLKVKT